MLTVTNPLSGVSVAIPIHQAVADVRGDADGPSHAWIPATAFAQLRVPQTCPPEDPQTTVPLRLFDPGFRNTAVCKSKVSFVDGDNGRLLYRGYDIEDLVERADFLEVAYLLIYDELPTPDEYKEWVRGIMTHTYLHSELEKQMLTFRYDAHPMGMVLSTLASLSTFHPEANPALCGETLYMKPKVAAGKNPTQDEEERIRRAEDARSRAVLRMLGKVTTIAANAYRHRLGRPYNPPMYGCVDYCENLLYMMDRLNEPDYRPDPRLVKILNKAFILLAENGSNCSTVMIRHLASSGVDPYTALSGSAGALFGERKSPAVIGMLKKIGSVDKIDDFLDRVKTSSTISRDPPGLNDSLGQGSLKRSRVRLMGFGHRIYKTHDPRVRLCKNLVLELFDLVGKTPIGELAIALETKALNDPYFIERKLYPNIDYWAAILFDTLNFPQDMFPVWMLIPRVAGLVAHLVESIDDPEYKIFRPRQIYVGENLRKYESFASSNDEQKLEQSMDSSGPKLDIQYARSNPQAARRRTTITEDSAAWEEMDAIRQALEEISRSLEGIERKKEVGNTSESVKSAAQPSVVGSMTARAASIRSAVRTWVSSRVLGSGFGDSVSGGGSVSQVLSELKAEVKRLQDRQTQLDASSGLKVSPTGSKFELAGGPDLLAGSGSPRVIARK